jgi:hypothetical protein
MRNDPMHAERRDEPVKFELPKDLVAEASRRSGPRDESFYNVEAFKPSFFGRVAELFTGKRR